MCIRDSLKIRRRISLSRNDVVAEAVDVRSEDRLDPIGVFFPYRFGPAAVRRRCDLGSRVAFDETRRLRELQPQDRFAFGTSARIERRRLADADGRCGGQHAALRFVGGLGYAIESRCEMREGHRAKRRSFPFRRHLERIVCLLYTSRCV